jgi:serine/threonine protein kinase
MDTSITSIRSLKTTVGSLQPPHSPQSSKTQINPIIEDYEEFKSIIMTHGKNVFTDVDLPEELLVFILFTFIDTGDMKKTYDEKYMDQLTHQFISIMVIYFKTDMDILSRGTMICDGTYGNVYEGSVKSRVYKACKKDAHCAEDKIVYDDDSNKIDDLNEIFSSTTIELSVKEFMFEIINYTIWMSIMAHCNALEMNLPNLSKNIIKIHKPFVVVCDNEFTGNEFTGNEFTGVVCDNELTGNEYIFRVGYEMDRYQGDVSNVLKNISNSIKQNAEYIKSTKSKIRYPDVDNANISGTGTGTGTYTDVDRAKKDAMIISIIDHEKQNALSKSMTRNVIMACVDMMDEFRQYDSLGITLLHRDSSPKNIMIDCIDYLDKMHTLTSVKFVDLSTLGTQLQFKDGNSVMIGHLFESTYNESMNVHYDLVFFLLFSVTYNNSSYLDIGLESRINKICKLNKYGNACDTNVPTTIWLYPYKIFFQYDTVKDRVGRAFN